MGAPSTLNPTALPEPEALRRICKAEAALEALLQPEDWLRRNSYFPNWSEGLQVAKVDNGAGDTLFCLFSPAGTVIKGFDHESPLSPHAQEEYQVWPGIYDGLPTPLSVLLDASAFEREDVTFCLWWPAGGKAWEIGPVEFPPKGDDGSSFLLGMLSRSAEEYADWARGYHETEVVLGAVQRVYERQILDEETARRINPSTDYEAVRQEILTILG